MSPIVSTYFSQYQTLSAALGTASYMHGIMSSIFFLVLGRLVYYFRSWFLRTASYINDKMVLCCYNCCYSVVREKYFIKHSSKEIHAVGWYSLVATRCPSLPHKVANISPCWFLQANELHTILSPKGETLQSTTCKHLREKEGLHVARVPLLLITSANVSTEGC